MQRSSVRNSVLDDVGNQFAQPGTAPWAKWFILQAQKCRKDLETEASELAKLLDKLEQGEAHKAIGIASFSILCHREIGLSDDLVDALRGAKAGQTVGAVLGKHGGDRKSEKANNQDDNIILIPEQGTSKDYLRARLARDYPDILRRLDAGEFKSVRAAALEAGIVKQSFQCPLDPVKAAQRILGRFEGKRLDALIQALSGKQQC